jgi:hypothetical protein
MYTDESFFKQLKIILDQQSDDIFKTWNVHADMLCLVGCMNMIEFIGGVLNGKLGLEHKAKCRFQAGFELFSDDWKRGIFSKSRIIFDKDDMWELRCSLTHEHTPKALKYQAVILIGTEHRETIWYDKDQSIGTPDERSIVSLPVEGLMIELAYTRKKLISLLEQDKSIREKANEALSRLPMFEISDSV